jgi:hypothetical protein
VTLIRTAGPNICPLWIGSGLLHLPFLLYFLTTLDDPYHHANFVAITTDYTMSTELPPPFRERILGLFEPCFLMVMAISRK